MSTGFWERHSDMIGSDKNHGRSQWILSSIVLIAALWGCAASANNMIAEKYRFSFKTKKSTCLLRINGLPTIDNATIPSGTMSAGFNITPYLENGANHIELLMGPHDSKDPTTLYPDSSCEVIFRKIKDGISDEISSYKLVVDDHGKITSKKSASEKSKYYAEGYTRQKNDYGLYKIRDAIIIEGLPAWSWVNARPVTNLDLDAIKKAYTDMAAMIGRRDIVKLKEITNVANQDIAFSQGVSPDFIFSSTDLPAHVMDKNFTLAPINWDEQTLITYANGRIFRFGTGFYQISPLQFINQDGLIIFSYDPYMSIINGKVIVVR